jgi:hypothetical protein
MLARNRVILPLDHLFGVGAAVLGGHVKEAGVCGRDELDFDGRCLGHFYVLSIRKTAIVRDNRQRKFARYSAIGPEKSTPRM